MWSFYCAYACLTSVSELSPGVLLEEVCVNFAALVPKYLCICGARPFSTAKRTPSIVISRNVAPFGEVTCAIRVAKEYRVKSAVKPG
jgi:hypothetical protein